jgi:hypothetical protein
MKLKSKFQILNQLPQISNLNDISIFFIKMKTFNFILKFDFKINFHMTSPNIGPTINQNFLE